MTRVRAVLGLEGGNARWIRDFTDRRAIIGGVITSTLLTLVVVPVLYAYLDDLGERRTARRAAACPAASDVRMLRRGWAIDVG